MRSYSWKLCASSAGIFVCAGRRIYWSSSASPVSGHRFSRVVRDKSAIDESFEKLSAGGLNDEKTGYFALFFENFVILFIDFTVTVHDENKE